MMKIGAIDRKNYWILTALPLATAAGAGVTIGLVPPKYAVALVFLAATVVLYMKRFEYFLLFSLVINEEFFYLLPRGPVGADGNYQDLLFVVLVIAGALHFLYGRKEEGFPFKYHVVSFVLLILIAVLKAYSDGQPLLLGLKAAKSYFLILFYYIFASRNFDDRRFVNAIVMAGVALAFINNIQYLSYGDLKIFHYESEFELERAGRLRFLVGDFFTLFAPLIAFGEYLMTRRKAYLLAFLYMVVTVIVQGQTRMVMLGMTVTSLAMLFISARLQLKKALLLGGLLLAVFLLIAPVLREGYLGDLFEETSTELTESEGNIGIRLAGYGYYLNEAVKSPVIGRGIWNDLFTENNPEDMKFMKIHLSDIGILNLVFHFGILGIAWLVVLHTKVYRAVSGRLRSITDRIHPGFIGYFVFSLVTMASLNCFTARRTIVYLALTLALISRARRTGEEIGG